MWLFPSFILGNYQQTLALARHYNTVTSHKIIMRALLLNEEKHMLVTEFNLRKMCVRNYENTNYRESAKRIEQIEFVRESRTCQKALRELNKSIKLTRRSLRCDIRDPDKSEELYKL